MPVRAPKRNAAFTLSDPDGKNSLRRCFRFSQKPAFEKKTAAPQSNGKARKSIGHRIMQSTAVKERAEKSSNKEQGSSLKKNLARNSLPGSVFKKRMTSKMPDFKKIHQHLFNNMESLSENKKRQQRRAQVLLQSPLVPRCAMLTQKTVNGQFANRSPMRKVQNTARTSVAPSTLATKLKTQVKTLTSVTAKQQQQLTAVTRTPLVQQKSLSTTSRTPVAKRKPGPTASHTPLAERKPAPTASHTPLAERKPAPTASCTPLTKQRPAPTASHTPLAERKPAPTASCTPLTKQKSALKSSCSPNATLKPLPTASWLSNRKQVKKGEASSIVWKNIALNLANRKEQERNSLKGVRMNKRFMLQMQKRQMDEDSEK